MNRLYRIIPKVFLNGVELHGRRFRERSLHYGEVPDSDFLEITNFDEAWNKSLLFCSCDKTFFKKKYISGHLDFWETMRVSEKNFETYAVEMTVNTYEDDCYTMPELAELLSSVDFVLWCKEHNLNACLINRKE